MCKLFYVLEINCWENALLNIISHPANTVFAAIHGEPPWESVGSFEAVGKSFSSGKNQTPGFSPFRYSHDPQLHRLQQPQRGPVVRLQQQRQRPGRVLEVSEFLQGQHMS